MPYFDNAATTLPKPPGVATAVAKAIAACGNSSRGAHEACLSALRLLERTRERIAELFRTGDPARVIFTHNATHALNIAIGGIRGHIVSTAAEHNSVLRPLHRRGNHTLVPLDKRGQLHVDVLEQAVTPHTEAVVMTHASNVTGNVFDLEAVAALCRRRALCLIVDAAQTAGLLPMDMTRLGIDALCCSGHKSLYGPQGTGLLCLGPNFTPDPIVVGGSGSDSFSPDHPSVLPEALEAGTVNAHGIAGLEVGLGHVMDMDGQCFAVADRLARRFADKVGNLDGYCLYGDMAAAARTPVVALNHERMDSAELAYCLQQRYDMAVRAGVHCAPLMHRALGTETSGAVRFSFSHYNTDAEVEFAIAALNELSQAM